MKTISLRYFKHYSHSIVTIFFSIIKIFIEKKRENNYNKEDKRERKKKYEKENNNYNLSNNCNSSFNILYSKQNSK